MRQFLGWCNGRSGGSTNKAIADALAVSDATVKFHLASLLRKLHHANRAEAVSRYLALLGMRAP